jgi:hypothetical protein
METFKTFKNPKDRMIMAGLIALACLFFWGIWNYHYQLLPQEVLVITEKPVYSSNDVLKLAIKNVLPKNVCFSSCYPYYLEIKGEKWVKYDYYEQCSHLDIIETCIKPDYAKFYEISLPDLAPGLHRLRVPVAVNEKEGEAFSADRVYYSNDFIVR